MKADAPAASATPAFCQPAINFQKVSKQERQRL
jgi:hypothetical protein